MLAETKYGWEATRFAKRKKRFFVSAKETTVFSFLNNGCCSIKTRLGKWFGVLVFGALTVVASY